MIPCILYNCDRISTRRFLPALQEDTSWTRSTCEWRQYYYCLLCL